MSSTIVSQNMISYDMAYFRESNNKIVSFITKKHEKRNERHFTDYRSVNVQHGTRTDQRTHNQKKLGIK